MCIYIILFINKQELIELSCFLNSYSIFFWRKKTKTKTAISSYLVQYNDTKIIKLWYCKASKHIAFFLTEIQAYFGFLVTSVKAHPQELKKALTKNMLLSTRK